MLVEFYESIEKQEVFCSSYMESRSVKSAMKTRSSNFAKIYTNDGRDYVDSVNLKGKYDKEEFAKYIEKVNKREEVLNFIEGSL